MNAIKDDVIKRNRDFWFVQHIEKHLKLQDIGKKGSMITPGKVGCTICGKDIDQIAEERMNSSLRAIEDIEKAYLFYQ